LAVSFAIVIPPVILIGGFYVQRASFSVWPPRLRH
jgi:hypothetical protein